MKIHVSNCLSLPALKYASVVAGTSGLDRAVSAISVLETTDVEDIEPSYLTSGELLISTLVSIRNNTDKQCALLYELDKADTSGLILFYVGKILPELDNEFLKIADELKYPIISIAPEGPSVYADVIHDIANYIFQMTLDDELALPELLLDFTAADRHHGELEHLLYEIGQYYNGRIMILDSRYRLLCCTGSALSASPDAPGEDPAPRIVQWYRRCHADDTATASVMTDSYLLDEHTVYSVNSCQITFQGAACSLLFVSERNDISYFFMNMLAQTVSSYMAKYEASSHIVREDELLCALLTNNYDYCDYLSSRNSLPLSEAAAIWVIYADTDEAADTNRMLLGQNKSVLSYCLKSVSDVAVPLYYGFYKDSWILLFGQDSSTEDLRFAAGAFLTEWNICCPDCSLFLYDQATSWKDIPAAYQLICHIRPIARKVYPLVEYYTRSHIYFLETCLSCLNHMANLESPSWPLVLEPLKEDDSLLSILETMVLDAYLDVKKSAELLYLHRNTVYYRLKKIQALLGYDPFAVPGISNISISLALRRILQT
ncbi:PucR family transcriptional regulator [Extibacter muris]|uniref:PucR family transcriptional regulator n=1 Tax=Extibacter muris TaxID=1796622 RepID=UPI001D08D6DC|nr:PucR family transcriptional regulator [Extibacter muris]MCB6202080.1 PucR family transcriptional regulator [Extibacter muris]MCQ4665705.1 PucR family transcriptional regulator [Extibacter muris]MCQ4693149.1 PucR family transcriptional regulator [Extibacter muris]